jgi:4-aminobutyrate aminotransferase-like enzyme
MLPVWATRLEEAKRSSNMFRIHRWREGRGLIIGMEFVKDGKTKEKAMKGLICPHQRQRSENSWGELPKQKY